MSGAPGREKTLPKKLGTLRALLHAEHSFDHLEPFWASSAQPHYERTILIVEQLRRAMEHHGHSLAESPLGQGGLTIGLPG
jgi:hypothetical protein